MYKLNQLPSNYSLSEALGMNDFFYLVKYLIEKDDWSNGTDAIEIYKEFVGIGIMEDFDTEFVNQYPQTYRSFINLMYDTMIYAIQRYPEKENDYRLMYKKLASHLLALRYGNGKPFGMYFQMEKSVSADVQDRFIQQWKTLLTSDAKNFKGLFRRMACTQEMQGKRPQNSISKWYDRTRFLWPESEITRLLQETLVPVIIRDDERECAFWARLFLRAATEAGITCDNKIALIINQAGIINYVARSGRKLRIGDTVNVLYPAWYQNGQLLERGYCR